MPLILVDIDLPLPAMGERSVADACYYSILGIRRSATLAEIRRSYKKLALKWHPDRRIHESPAANADANRWFQRIQEAYSVLSDSGKRTLYDAGIFDPFDDDDQDFTDFMEEMLSMMKSEKREKPNTLEDLQKLFIEMASGMDMLGEPYDCSKRRRVESSTSDTGSFY